MKIELRESTTDRMRLYDGMADLPKWEMLPEEDFFPDCAIITLTSGEHYRVNREDDGWVNKGLVQRGEEQLDDSLIDAARRVDQLPGELPHPDLGAAINEILIRRIGPGHGTGPLPTN